MSFLEVKLADEISYSSSYSEKYAVDVHRSLLYNYRVLKHPYPTTTFHMIYGDQKLSVQLSRVVDMFHKVGGMFGAFRIKHPADYSTNNYMDVPTASDQRCEVINYASRTWQMMRWYGDDLTDLNISRRILKKIVSGSTVIGIEDANGNYFNGFFSPTVDVNSGIITLPTNLSGTITAITKAAQAVITMVGHSLTTSNSIVMSGVVGMTQINGVRGDIVNIAGSDVTVDIDTNSFSPYSSGGQADSNPTVDEFVTAGCYFDLPVVFLTDLSDVNLFAFDAASISVQIEEIRIP